jgi:hypothetical protein
MKTKYPNQIDTPSELPIVRDNITEITSDVINSLRSAIIQIEKTLGIFLAFRPFPTCTQ